MKYLIDTQVKFLVLVASLFLFGCATGHQTTENRPNSIRAGSYFSEIQLENMQKNFVYELDECDMPPLLLSGRAPSYRPKAFGAKLKPGKVTINFDINKDGTTDNFEVQESTSHEFSAAVLLVMKYWKFEPAKLRGIPVKVRARKVFLFEPER